MSAAGKKRGRKSGKPGWRAPKKGTVKRTVPASKHKRNTRGLRPPWPKGVSGNPKGMKRGSGTVEIHKAFYQLLRTVDPRTKLKMIDTIFWELMKDVKIPTRRAAAARTLLAWGVGMPNQMIRIAQSVDLQIGVAKGLDTVDLEHLENFEIYRPEAKRA